MGNQTTSFTRFFEAAHEGFYIGTLDGSGSTTAAANARLKLVLGYPPETPEWLVLPFDPERFVDADARLAFLGRLQKSGAVADHLLRLRRLDNSVAWVEVTAAAECTDEGHLRVEAVVRDVGERRRLDNQSRDIQTELLQAEKMAALGHTISGVAHELNNPLATILSWAERLSAQPGDERAKRGLAVILGEAERAARIVRNLLTFARKRQSTRGLVDVNQVVRETLALRAYEQRVSNITLIEALASGLPPVFADGHQIKQVFLNLVINAEQAMLSSHGRGTLVIRSWHDHEKDSVLIEINDDGPGVPGEVQTRIFDPFFTTKEVGKGTGLGLSVAYALVKEHAGRIWLRSEGDGTSFYVELPVTVKAEPAPGPTPSATVSLDSFKGTRVLVVEDEPALAMAVAEALVDAGFVVDRAGDGEEGLSRLAEQSYDLIVCDLKMPRIDGVQFYRAMAAATPGLTRRVIFVTGDVAGTDAERFLDETGCRWLSKPFRLGDLLRAARDTLS
ncbi:MAG TPA: ATP-binding protein [Vicinamibacterales bacterium]|nr:ATP-binding protein [Vicinamibacterales bacterium]